MKLFATLLLPLTLMVNNRLNADEFNQCLSKLEQLACQSGISEKTVQAALTDAKFLPEVIQLDRYQPEFNKTLYSYLDIAVSEDRLTEGRLMLREHQSLLDKLWERYGVPPHTLIAFWGLESNFGKNMGRFKIIDSLTTLACDTRRSSFFTSELIAALKLMDQYGFQRESLVGSWAGAIGHTQFLPSNYLKFAIANKDNGSPPDLWSNVPDALTSAAHFLSQLGWQKGWKWGREVSVPADFNFKLAGLTHKKTLDEWHRLGVRTVFNDQVPPNEVTASLLIPAGHKSTAFLVYPNFDIIMKWNRSILYAIGIGYLADRLNGHRPLNSPPKPEPALSKSHVLALQTKLNAMGFNCGKADGLTGTATYQAISNFQLSRNMVADGYPSKEVFEALGIKQKL